MRQEKPNKDWFSRFTETKNLAAVILFVIGFFFYSEVWPWIKGFNELASIRVKHGKISTDLSDAKELNRTLQAVIDSVRADRSQCQAENAGLLKRAEYAESKVREIPEILSANLQVQLDIDINTCLEAIRKRADADWVVLMRRENGTKFLDGGTRTYYTATHEMTEIRSVRPEFQRQPDSLFGWHPAFLDQSAYLKARNYMYVVKSTDTDNEWLRSILSEHDIRFFGAAPVYDPGKRLIAVVCIGFFKRDCPSECLLMKHLLWKEYSPKLSALLARNKHG